MTVSVLIRVCIVTTVMFILGYVFGRVEEACKRGPNVNKALDISKYINSDNAPVEVEREQDGKGGDTVVSDVDPGDLRDPGN